MPIAFSAQQRTDCARCFFHLPERIAAMLHIADRVECSDLCKRDEVFAVERGDALGQVIDGTEFSGLRARNDTTHLPRMRCSPLA